MSDFHNLDLIDPPPVSPLPLLDHWFKDAAQLDDCINPLAMSLATVGSGGWPSNRMVLCKRLDTKAGFVVFFTNYHSRKGQDLVSSSRAAAVFYWDRLRRQVRIEGPVVPSPPVESDAYFTSRPRASRIAAWASDQSRPVVSREVLLARLSEQQKRFEDPNHAVPRPYFWGGYRLYIRALELWINGRDRIHDRIRWDRELHPTGNEFEGGEWAARRLQP